LAELRVAKSISISYASAIIFASCAGLAQSAPPVATKRGYPTKICNCTSSVQRRRLFGPLGHLPPAEAEANDYAVIEALKMAE